MLTAILAGTLGASTVSAAERIAVVPLCDSPALVREVATAVNDALLQRGHEVPTLAPATGVACSRRSLGEATALLEAGRTAFQALRFDEAARALDAVVQSVEAADFASARDAYLEARFYLGWLAFERGRTAEARAHFRALVRIDSTWRPDPSHFPPTVTSGFARERSALLGETRARVAFTSSPPDAAVWLDGAERCRTPCTLDDVVPGAHTLRVSSVGHADWRDQVTVASGALRNLEVRLVPDNRALLAEQLRASDARSLAAAFPGQRLVVFVHSEPDHLRARILEVESPALAGPLELPAHAQEAARTVVAELDARQSLLTAPLAALPAPAAEVVTEAPVWRRPWLWASVTVVAAGLGIGAWALTNGESDGRTLRVRMP